MKNKYVAAVMAFVFGTFGIHKFYLRERGAGVFYIMLFVMTSRFFPISTFLGIIDGVRYLTMGEEEFDRKYNSRSSERLGRRRLKRMKRQKEYYDYSQGPGSRYRRKKASIRSNPFKKSGLKKYKEYDIEEAIIDFEKGLKLQPNDIALHFNLACSFSLLENTEKAYYHIGKCVDYGFTDTNKILTHEDLAFMRIQPEFEEFKANGFKQKDIKEDPKDIMDELLLEKLRKLVEMRRRGIVTETDFKIEREKILRKA